MKALNVGIPGAGVGGMCAAVALLARGHAVTIFEQASQFGRVGADVNLTPNAVRALDSLGHGIGQAVREHGAQPTHRISRDYATGAETSRLPMSSEAEAKYGAPQVTIHRADLLAALTAALPQGVIRFGRRLSALHDDGTGVDLVFDDGARERFDIVVGADGIHSRVRAALFGEEHPRFTGVVSYRAVVSTERVKDVPEIAAFTKWWGPNPQSQIVTFPLNQGRETFVFATTGQDSWHEESWTSAGDVVELRSHYRDYHPDARRLLESCDSVLKSALYEREPLARWSRGGVTLLGDACHPMLPFMAQGACMAIEDAVVLGRCLDGAASRADAERALQAYEQARRERTAQIQIASRGNQWMKTQGNADWVYGYDAAGVDLPSA